MRLLEFRRWSRRVGIHVAPNTLRFGYHRSRGRGLYTTRVVEAYEVLVRIPAAAMMQSVDVLLNHHLLLPTTETTVARGATDDKDKKKALSWLNEEWSDSFFEEQRLTLAREYRRIFNLVRRSVQTTGSDDGVDDDDEVEHWLIAMILTLKMKMEPLLECGYVKHCLPRHPYHWDRMADIAVSRRLVPSVEGARWLMINEVRRRVEIASRLLKSPLMQCASAADVVTSSSDDDDEIQRQQQQQAETTMKTLVWAYGCSRSRSHPFSLSCSSFTPRVYPLPPTTTTAAMSDASEDVLGIIDRDSMTLCPFFDMINDGEEMNVRFIDVPTTTTTTTTTTSSGSGSNSSHEEFVRRVLDKNRDLIIEAGPRGLQEGEELLMCYAPVRKGGGGTGGDRVPPPPPQGALPFEEVQTLLKFGFLPTLLERRGGR